MSIFTAMMQGLAGLIAAHAPTNERQRDAVPYARMVGVVQHFCVGVALRGLHVLAWAAAQKMCSDTVHA